MFIFVTIGFKPVKYRCSIAQCDESDASFQIKGSPVVSESPTIFMNGSAGALDFCRARPLKSSMIHELGKCTINDFDMTGDPVVCDAQQKSIIFEDLPMNSTIVTEFNLFCNEEYKAKYCINLDFNQTKYVKIYEPKRDNTFFQDKYISIYYYYYTVWL